MNHIYKVIFNKATGTFVAVTEYARAHGKGSTGSVSASEPVSTAGKLIRFSLIMSGIMLSTLSFAATGEDLPTTQTQFGDSANYCFYHTESDTVICGDGTTTDGTNSNGVVLGKTAQITGHSAIAIGNGASSAVNAVSIGRDAKATNNKDIAIGYFAGKNLNDKGSNFNGTGKVSFVAGSTFTKGAAGDVATIATNNNISIGEQAGQNATGRQNINLGKSAGTQHFGEDSVTIGTNANNFNSAKNVDGSALAVGDTFRARNTIAIGSAAMTYGENSIAIGNNASTKQVSYNNGANYTTGDSAIAVGSQARAAGNNAIAQGTNSVAQGINDIVIGLNAKAEIDPAKDRARSSGIAIGTNAKVGPAASGNSIAIGTGAKVLAGNNSTAVGSFSQTIGNNLNVALGNSNRTWGDRANAIGNSATAGGYDSTAIGAQSHVLMQYNSNANVSNNGVAVGAASLVGGGYSVAVGNAVAVFGQNSGAFSASSSSGNADEAFKQGDTAKTTGLGQVSIIGGNNNFAIGNANVIGTTSHNNMVMGNRIAVGATNATMSNPLTLYRLAIRDTATGQTKVDATAYIKDGNNYYAYNKDAAANGYKGAQLDLTGKSVTDEVTFTHIIPTFNNTKGIERSVAIGQSASVQADDSIAIGTGATAGDATKTKTRRFVNGVWVTEDPAANAIAIGNAAKALAKNSISIGTQNLVTAANAGAIGDPSIVSGAGSYTLGNDNAVGSTSSNVGAFGNNNQIGATATYVDGKLQTVSGLTDTATVENSRAVGNKNYINTSNTYVLGSGVGTKDNGSVLGTVENSVYLGNDSTVAKGAAVGTKNLTKEGAEGTTTTAGDIGTVDTATVAGVTYGSFAGKTAAGAVSVGSAGLERRVMNVAAGEISATSTDAINGSQLYMVAKGTLDQMPVIYTDTSGNKVYKQPDGSFVDSTGAPYKGDVIASMNDGDTTADTPQTLANVAGNLPNTYNTDAYNPNSNAVTKSQTLPVDAQSNPLNVNNAATVGDILNSGWNLQGNGTAKDFVKPYDTVNFVNGAGTTAKVETATDGKSSTVTYDVNVDNDTIKINNNGQLYADIPTPAAPKNTFHTNNSATTVAASGTNNVDSVDGVGSATGGYSLAAGLNAQATAYRAQAVGQAAEAHGAYSVADGFLTKANRESTVAIGNSSVAGLAPTAATTAYDARGGVNTVAIGNSAQALTSQSIAIGNNAKVNPVYHGDDANNTFNTSKLYAAGIAIGNIAKTEGLDSIALGSLTKAQSDVAIAVGRATQVTGFNSTGIGTANNISGTSSAAVGSSNAVSTNDTFVLGSNVKTTADNSVFLGKDAAYVAQGTTTDGIGAVTQPVTVGGTLTYGDFAGATSVGVVSVGDVGKERRIQNMAAGLISATSTDAINGSQLYATNAKLGNIADTVVDNFGGNADLNEDGSITYTNIGNTGKDNVHDAIQAATTVVKAGTNVVVDEATNATTGQKEYTVNAWDTTVTAAADSAVTVTPTIDDTNRTRAYAVTVNTDGDTIKVENGKLTANTTPLTNADGKVETPANENALATAGDIANAINNSGFNIIGAGNNAGGAFANELINPGDTVTLEAGKNLTVAQTNGQFVFATADDVNFNSVQIGADGPKITNDGNNIKVGDKDGNATSITNITSGLTTNNINTAPTGTGSTATSPIVDLNNTNVSNNTAATVGDLRNMGWVVSASDNGYVDTVKNANQVDFVGTGLATVSGKTENGIRTITVDVNAQSTVETAQTPVVYTNKDGDKVYKKPDGTFVDDKGY